MAYATIKNGSSGSDVKTWQEYLIKQGYDVGSTGADGKFGSKTLAATKQYQKDNGLAVDGIVGSNTWASTSSSSKNSSNKTTTTTTPKLKGVSDSATEILTTKYTPSDSVQSKLDKADSTANTAVDFLTNTSLNDVLSPEIAQADAWIKEQLSKIQSGKTSWSDQYSNAINEYLNREKFEYDVDNDQLFQQALASAMNSGKSAMQDTIGQASALTGGYGSTYATSAGNQAYNQFIEDAYNNLPEYYQMAMEAYQMEGQEMINRVNMLGTADDKEYGRMVDSYNTTLDYTNTLWDRGYKEWTATGDNLTNAATIAGNNANSAFEREFNIDSAYKDTWSEIARMENNDYWNQDSSNLNWNQYKVSTGDTNGDGVLSSSEKAAMNTNYSYDSNGNVVKNAEEKRVATNTQLANYKQEALKKYNEGGNAALDEYIDSLGLSETEKNEIGVYIYGDDENEGYGVTPIYDQAFYKTKDTYNNFAGWFNQTHSADEDDVDWNDKVAYKDKDGKVHEFTLKQLKAKFKEAGMTDKEIDEKLMELTLLRVKE